jgi:hypothetical protein
MDKGLTDFPVITGSIFDIKYSAANVGVPLERLARIKSIGQLVYNLRVTQASYVCPLERYYP